MYMGNGQFLLCNRMCVGISFVLQGHEFLGIPFVLQGHEFLVDLYVLPICGLDIVLGR